MKKVLFCCVILLSCFQITQAEDENWVYTTRPGDTLWGISKNHLKGVEYWSKVQKYNGIKNPKLLPPGSRLLIPVTWLKQQPTPAVVISVSGIAQLKLPDKIELQQLKAGMKVFIQSEIITANEAIVVLKFADESRLIIQQNSSVSLNVLSAFGSNGMVDTRVRLQRGRVDTRVVPFKNKDSRFEITTPAAVASVRGTHFRVSMNPKSSVMLSEVVEGKVAVASQGVTQIVPAGFGTRVEQGKAPLAPQALLPAPDISKLESSFHTSPVKLSWPALPGAKSYHVEISPNSDFFTVLFDEITSIPNTSWKTKEVGEFSVRIRGINEFENEGLGSVHQFLIIADLPRPQLVSPIQNTLIEKKNFTFQWLGHSDAKRYHLQVSLSPQFEETSIEVSGDQQFYSVSKKLIPGKYYWRVANEYQKGIVGAYSDVFQFNINAQP